MTKLKDGNIIQIFGEITEEMSIEFVSSVLELAQETDPITILINSDGGCLYSSFAIHDIIKSLDNKIITIGIGKVMSAAVFLLASGDERKIMPNTTLMLHEPSLSNFNVSNDVKVGDMGREYEHLKGLKSQMYKMLAKYTNKSLKQITEDLEGKDFYLTAKEAKEYGIIDSIIRLKNSKNAD